MHSRLTISLGFIFTAVSLAACVQEEVAKKKLVSLDAKPQTCLLDQSPDPSSSKAIPSPQPLPELSVADDIYMAFNCSEKFDIRWDKPLVTQELILNGKVIVYGSSSGCASSNPFPLIKYLEAVDSELKQSIDAYNLNAQKRLVQSNEGLNAALKAAKTCSFKNQGDLLNKLISKDLGFALDQAGNQAPAPRPYKVLPASDLIEELSCLGAVTLQPSSAADLLKDYASLKADLAKDPAMQAKPTTTATSGGGSDNPCD